MATCDKCQSWSPEDSSICHRCGSSLRNLSDGGARLGVSYEGPSLAVAYWIYYACGGTVVGVIIGSLLESAGSTEFRIFIICACVYMAWAFWVVLKASRYARSKFWSVLANLFSAVGTSINLMIMAYLFIVASDGVARPSDLGGEIPRVADELAVAAYGRDEPGYSDFLGLVESRVDLVNPRSPRYDERVVEIIDYGVDRYIERGVGAKEALRMAVWDVTGINVPVPRRGGKVDSESIDRGAATSIRSPSPFLTSPRPLEDGVATASSDVESQSSRGAQAESDKSVSYGTPHRWRSWKEMRDSAAGGEENSSN